MKNEKTILIIEDRKNHPIFTGMEHEGYAVKVGILGLKGYGNGL